MDGQEGGNSGEDGYIADDTVPPASGPALRRSGAIKKGRPPPPHARVMQAVRQAPVGDGLSM
jgi:hypothetical protein